MNLCKIQSHRVGEAWGGVGRGGILNWIVVIFNLIIYIYRYKNNTLFTHSLGVELVFGKTLFSQDDLSRWQKYFKRVKDIVYLWKTVLYTVYFTMTSCWNKSPINGYWQDFYYDSLLSWQGARVFWVQCRASLFSLDC